MTEAKINDEIARLNARRSAIWAGAENAPGEAARIGKKLADLYDERRSVRAQQTSGRRRPDIVKHARVESELERLMTRR